jgi:hypothetical protein
VSDASAIFGYNFSPTNEVIYSSQHIAGSYPNYGQSVAILDVATSAPVLNPASGANQTFALGTQNIINLKFSLAQPSTGSSQGANVAFIDPIVNGVTASSLTLYNFDLKNLSVAASFPQPPPTAILSNLAYQSASSITAGELLPGYSVLMSNGHPVELIGAGVAAGLHAIAFQGPNGITLAFQGTSNLLSLQGWADTGFSGDILDVGGINALKAYVSASNQFISTVVSEAPPETLHLTGYSLDGGIAQMLGSVTGLDTVTFNSPGTSRALAVLQILGTLPFGSPDQNANIQNYRIQGDLVSLLPGAHTQLGEVITLPSNVSINSSSLQLTALQNHSMATIFSQIDQPPVSILFPDSNGNTDTSSLQSELGGIAWNTASVLASWIVGSASDVSTGIQEFSFPVSGDQLYPIDPPSGSEYIFATGFGNPNFASVILPAQADPYDLQALINNLWVDEGLLMPLTTFNFGNGGVSEFEVFNVDVDPTNPGPFIVGVTFAGDGQFTGTVTSISSVPEPSTLTVLLGPIIVGLLVFPSRRRVVR